MAVILTADRKPFSAFETPELSVRVISVSVERQLYGAQSHTAAPVKFTFYVQLTHVKEALSVLVTV